MGELGPAEVEIAVVLGTFPSVPPPEPSRGRFVPFYPARRAGALMDAVRSHQTLLKQPEADACQSLHRLSPLLCVLLLREQKRFAAEKRHLPCPRVRAG